MAEGKASRATINLDEYGEDMKKEILRQLKKRERRRKAVCLLCALAAVGCLGYFGAYYYLSGKTSGQMEELASLKTRPPVSDNVAVHNTGPKEAPDILDEYKNLYNKNKSLIGWLKIDDTIIDYPVMQSPDSEYYLTHNFSQEQDNNGSIFMDPACDVLKPSTNLILYGHHMKSGKMFGKLSLYEDEQYMKKHPEIKFDTIYEKGTYRVMYAFRSKLYQDSEITFKYYQFTDANSQEEFASNMAAMADMSYYDTGVTAVYGDRLLTLSTCDDQEKDGRFVVVAKKIR